MFYAPGLFDAPGLGCLPFYQWYEMQHAALAPARATIGAARVLLESSSVPFGWASWGRYVAASCEMFERATRRYHKPEWGIHSTVVNGSRIDVQPSVVWERPFFKLTHFAPAAVETAPPRPKMLLVAPMSGHHATLLRGTVEAFLPDHDVYITDWSDARTVPLTAGGFDLDDYIDAIIEMLRFLRGNIHVVAVCQPSVPVLAAVSLMETDDDPAVPLSMTLMGGPIDPRSNPTEVNQMAERNGIDWFRRNVITRVPFPNPGAMREVYPGFLQLAGFMSMSIERHLDAHRDLFAHLVRGNGDSVAKHCKFYDEYLAVMDLPAEFYLQTVEDVFIRHALARGEMTHRGRPVEPARIRGVALLTIEGENDDITGLGQTQAAHRLCTSIPEARKAHHLQHGVGHFGVFNGARFRREIAPRVARFIRSNDCRPAQRTWARGVAARLRELVAPPLVPQGGIDAAENGEQVSLQTRTRKTRSRALDGILSGGRFHLN